MSEPDVVTRAKAAMEGIAPGPWELELVDGEPVEHWHFNYDSTEGWYDVVGPNGGWMAHCQDIPAARFIAAARDLVPELIAEIERLRAQVENAWSEGWWQGRDDTEGDS